MKTQYFKDARNGWEARTVVDLSTKQQLDLTTRKDINGNLSTRATVHWLLAGGVRRHAMSFGAAGGDFSQTIKTTKPARITANVVENQHGLGLEMIAQITKAALAHYERHDAPKEDMFLETELQESVEA